MILDFTVKVFAKLNYPKDMDQAAALPNPLRL
jgi:hypothetical protein